MISFSESLNMPFSYRTVHHDVTHDVVSDMDCVYAELTYELDAGNADHKWQVHLKIKPNISDYVPAKEWDDDEDTFEDYTFDGTYSIAVAFSTSTKGSTSYNMSHRQPVDNQFRLFATILKIIDKEPDKLISRSDLHQIEFSNQKGYEDRARVAVYSRLASMIANQRHMRVILNGPNRWVIGH